MVAQLIANQRSIMYAVYPDEGHEITKPRNRISEYALIDAFLAHYLGGKISPIDEDLIGSTLVLKEGADLIAPIEKAYQALQMERTRLPTARSVD